MRQREVAQENKNTGAASSIKVGMDEQKLSLIGGAALLVMAFTRPRRWGIWLGPVGANMIYRGLTGRSMVYEMMGKNSAVHDKDAAISVPHEQGIRVVHSITIDRPIEEIYTFWRDFSNLPRFMKHLEEVTIKSPTRSHWRVKGPAGTTVEWDAEIINEQENAVIGWRSLENPFVDHAGSVRFRPAPGVKGTEITVEMEYAPLGGGLGAAIAAIFGEAPERQIWDDLHRLKQHLEVGQVASTDGQPSGRD